jgi:hypothetical protein
MAARATKAGLVRRTSWEVGMRLQARFIDTTPLKQCRAAQVEEYLYGYLEPVALITVCDKLKLFLYEHSSSSLPSVRRLGNRHGAALRRWGRQYFTGSEVEVYIHFVKKSLHPDVARRLV